MMTTSPLHGAGAPDAPQPEDPTRKAPAIVPIMPTPAPHTPAVPHEPPGHPEWTPRREEEVPEPARTPQQEPGMPVQPIDGEPMRA